MTSHLDSRLRGNDNKTMATITFYEKPGCGNNTKQKALLTAAGHQVEARNMLTHPWSAAELLEFFGQRPVAEWFNRAAPRIKSGEVVPEALDATSALHLLLQDHLLIRRPLIASGGRKEIGFDPDLIHAWLGLTPTGQDLESCPRARTCTRPARRH
ncbi:MAG TPA: ArsC/Spx/MgsR family protein [Gallionellaceae bacterium]